MKNKASNFTCCLCGGKFEGFGNNPYPLVGKKCCNLCNSNFVVPIRERMFFLDILGENQNSL